ncbi:MAG TPA: hypothetical protein VFL61_06965, partial [Gaiellaceae bacterium]|nr:hypothetical protein [Gaiellaceae bacterium]
DRRFLTFADVYLSGFLAQGRAERRTLEETLGRAWQVASTLPRRELSMVTEALVGEHYVEGDHEAADPGG